MTAAASTVLEQAPAATGVSDGPRRRRRLLAAGLALVLAGAGGWLTYMYRYQPWQPGNFGQWEGNQVVGITDGVRETGLIVTAKPGQAGWFGYSVRLTGWRDVKVLGAVDFPFADPSEVRVKWQVVRREDMPDSPATATTAAVVVHPGESLVIWVVLKAPSDCGGGGTTSIHTVGLRWTALGVHHVYWAPITIDGTSVPLYLCSPAAALKHLYQPL